MIHACFVISILFRNTFHNIPFRSVLFLFVLFCIVSFRSFCTVPFRFALYCVILFYVILYVQEHKSNVSLPGLHACNANYLAITFVLSLSSSSRSESEFESELSSLESLLTEFDKENKHDINIIIGIFII